MPALTPELRQQALDYLQTHHVLTLATHGEDGIWATAVFYAAEGFALTFLSAGHTRHAQHIAQNPHCAATIQENHTEWSEIQGIQLEGMVHLLKGLEREKAITGYMARHPFLAQAPPPLQIALTKVNWYLLTPSRLYLIDNRKGFGHRDEIPL